MNGIKLQIDKLLAQIHEIMILPDRIHREIYDINFYSYTNQCLHCAILIINHCDLDEKIRFCFEKLVKKMKEVAKKRPQDEDDDDKSIGGRDEVSNFLNTRRPLKINEIGENERGELHKFLTTMEEKEKDTLNFLSSVGKVKNHPPKFSNAVRKITISAQTEIQWLGTYPHKDGAPLYIQNFEKQCPPTPEKLPLKIVEGNEQKKLDLRDYFAKKRKQLLKQNESLALQIDEAKVKHSILKGKGNLLANRPKGKKKKIKNPAPQKTAEFLPNFSMDTTLFQIKSDQQIQIIQFPNNESKSQNFCLSCQNRSRKFLREQQPKESDELNNKQNFSDSSPLEIEDRIKSELEFQNDEICYCQQSKNASENKKMSISKEAEERNNSAEWLQMESHSNQVILKKPLLQTLPSVNEKKQKHLNSMCKLNEALSSMTSKIGRFYKSALNSKHHSQEKSLESSINLSLDNTLREQNFRKTMEMLLKKEKISAEEFLEKEKEIIKMLMILKENVEKKGGRNRKSQKIQYYVKMMEKMHEKTCGKECSHLKKFFKFLQKHNIALKKRQYRLPIHLIGDNDFNA